MFCTRSVRVTGVFSKRHLLNKRCFSSPVSRSLWMNRSRFSKVGVTLLSLAAAGFVLNQGDSYQLDVNKFNETPESIESSISVEKSIPPFQIYVKDPLSAENQLIGYGIRTVTFLKFQVYGLGIYVNKEDIARIPEILDSKFLTSFYDKLGDHDHLNHREKLLLALKDPELSVVLIENLLNSQIKFTANIVPLRNTDFNHLRDGLIKSIMASPKSKEILQQDDGLLPAGLDELRKAFGARRGSCPKGHKLFLEVLKDQSMVVRYQEINGKTGEITNHVLGEVKEPLVGKLLFLQYLSGPKPLSNETREVAVEKLASFC